VESAVVSCGGRYGPACCAASYGGCYTYGRVNGGVDLGRLVLPLINVCNGTLILSSAGIVGWLIPKFKGCN